MNREADLAVIWLGDRDFRDATSKSGKDEDNLAFFFLAPMEQKIRAEKEQSLECMTMTISYR